MDSDRARLHPHRLYGRFKSLWGFLRLLGWGIYHCPSILYLAGRVDECSECDLSSRDLCNRHKEMFDELTSTPVFGEEYNE